MSQNNLTIGRCVEFMVYSEGSHVKVLMVLGEILHGYKRAQPVTWPALLGVLSPSFRWQLVSNIAIVQQCIEQALGDLLPPPPIYIYAWQHITYVSFAYISIILLRHRNRQWNISSEEEERVVATPVSWRKEGSLPS